jgi:hypothetical protein
VFAPVAVENFAFGARFFLIQDAQAVIPITLTRRRKIPRDVSQSVIKKPILFSGGFIENV